MAVFAGKYKYKDYDIDFWLTPKMIKATIWKPGTLVLVKRFFARDYTELKRRIIHYLNTGKVSYG